MYDPYTESYYGDSYPQLNQPETITPQLNLNALPSTSLLLRLPELQLNGRIQLINDQW